jgi:hypothetical protein
MTVFRTLGGALWSLISARSRATSDRIRQTVALLGRRAYALAPVRLVELCLGGSISPDEVRWSVAASRELSLAEDIVVGRSAMDRVGDIRSRALGHCADAAHGYSFVPIASRGAIEVTYTVDAAGVSVAVRPIRLAPGFTLVGILNEQSAAFDDFANAIQTLVGPRFPNWVSVEGSWGRLRSASLGVEWSAPIIAGAELHAGRELIRPDFDWTGLDYLFPANFAGTTYHVNMQEAR